MSRQASCISENFWDSGEAVELCKTAWTGWLHFLELSVGRDIDRVPAWLEKASGSGNLTRRDRASLQGEVWKPLDYISRNVQQQQVGRLRANPRRKQTLSSCFEIEVCHIAIEQHSLSSAKKKQPYHVNQHSAAKSLFLETDSASLGIKRRKCFSSMIQWRRERQ